MQLRTVSLLKTCLEKKLKLTLIMSLRYTVHCAWDLNQKKKKKKKGIHRHTLMQKRENLKSGDSEVSQKEKNKYRILKHIYGIWKNGTDDFIYKAEI